MDNISDARFQKRYQMVKKQNSVRCLPKANTVKNMLWFLFFAGIALGVVYVLSD